MYRIMKLLNTKYSTSAENYNKKTPVWIKIMSDIILGIAGIVAVSCPDFPGKEWVVFCAICVKFIGKTITEELEKI